MKEWSVGMGYRRRLYFTEKQKAEIWGAGRSACSHRGTSEDIQNTGSGYERYVNDFREPRRTARLISSVDPVHPLNIHASSGLPLAHLEQFEVDLRI